MIKIEGARGSGKTTKLLHIAKEHEYTIIVPNIRYREFTRDLAREHFGKDHGIKIMTMHEFHNRLEGNRNEQLLIDNLDYILQDHHIVGYTMNKEDEA